MNRGLAELQIGMMLCSLVPMTAATGGVSMVACMGTSMGIVTLLCTICPLVQRCVQGLVERDNHAQGTSGMSNKTFVEYATLS